MPSKTEADDAAVTPRVRQAILLARRSVPPDPKALADVTAAIAKTRAPKRPAFGRGLLPLAPAQWLSAAVVLLTIGFGAGLLVDRMAGSARTSSRVTMSFVFVAPDAERVALAGDFNDWNARATPLQGSHGVWSAQLELSPGNYSYAFVVNDSIWYADPRAPVLAQDDFGRPSSIVLVRRGT